MRLVSYTGGFGRLDGDTIVPMGRSILEYLRFGRAKEQRPIPRGSVALCAPVPDPPKILGVGLNYRDHAAETGQALPEEPVLFAKFRNSVIGPGAVIEMPAACNSVDYEAELGVVIGRVCRRVREEHALEYVAGYTCLNDVSDRKLQLATSQWLRGKAVDTFLPMGPALVTCDEVPDPQCLHIGCMLNGEVVQDSRTSEMAFSVSELIALISATLTLEPGDIIATGTPPGVGYTRIPPLFLKSGDEVSVDVERVGTLVNRVSRQD